MSKGLNPDSVSPDLNLSCLQRLSIKIQFGNTIGSKGLDPDQNKHFVGPDLGSNCLQRLSADSKVAASKERV